MSDAETGQVVSGAAEIYDRFFVPAIFGLWAPRTCDAANLEMGDRVLDVACGTGAVARAARERVGDDGEVVGVDLNPGMLAVARRHEPFAEWVEAPAERLPFDDDRFDAVLCQFGLMFFTDRAAALREMRRVARPGAGVVATVWTGVEEAPAYAAMVELLDDLLGRESGDAVRAPFCLGDPRVLADLFAEAGLAASVTTVPGTTRFPSLEDWVRTEIMGWTLAGTVSGAEVDRVLAAAPERLAPYVREDGIVEFDNPARFVRATV